VETRSEPFPHVVADGLIERELVECAFRAVPAPGSAAWHARYDNWAERKRASELLPDGPLRTVADRVADPALVEALRQRLDLECPLVADDARYGAGLHVHDPGGFLAAHLDYARHPRRDAERRLNVVVFLNPAWSPDWGGGLELWDEMAETVVATIVPAPGRCVAWEPTDVAFHSVSTVTGPEPRVTLASYFLSVPARPSARRRRALFVPPRTPTGRQP
jgi:hypothetical protein